MNSSSLLPIDPGKGAFVFHQDPLSCSAESSNRAGLEVAAVSAPSKPCLLSSLET